MDKALGHTRKQAGHKPSAEAIYVLGIFQTQAWSKPVQVGESEAHKERKRKAHYPQLGVDGMVWLTSKRNRNAHKGAAQRWSPQGGKTGLLSEAPMEKQISQGSLECSATLTRWG